MKSILMAGLLLAAASMSAQQVIAQWDFTTGKTTSVDGKLKGSLRGATRITKDEKGQSMLTIGMTNSGEGILFSRADIPRLSIKGGFRVDSVIQVREQTAKGYSMVLYDCNYYMSNLPRFRKNPEAMGGFVMLLHRVKGEKLRPVCILAHGDNLEHVYGNVFSVPEYTNFSYAMEYDGVKTVRFYINGKLNKEVKVKQGGPIGQIYKGPSLGDRVGSNYNRFDGSILKLKITALPQK